MLMQQCVCVCRCGYVEQYARFPVFWTCFDFEWKHYSNNYIVGAIEVTYRSTDRHREIWTERDI